MSKQQPIVSNSEAAQGSPISYAVGFLLSIILTLAAYALATNHDLAGWSLVFALIGLAIVQLFVQMVFFLHLAKKSKPRWNLMVFLFMLMVVTIVVVGSLWIMYNLNYRQIPKTPQQINQYMNSQGGL